jgi:hypothetical protein
LVFDLAEGLPKIDTVLKAARRHQCIRFQAEFFQRLAQAFKLLEPDLFRPTSQLLGLVFLLGHASSPDEQVRFLDDSLARKSGSTFVLLE